MIVSVDLSLSEGLPLFISSMNTILHSNAKFSQQKHFSNVTDLRNIVKTVFLTFAVVAHPQSEYHDMHMLAAVHLCVLLCNFRGLKMGSQAWKAIKEPWSESRFDDERLLYLSRRIPPHKVLHRRRQIDGLFFNSSRLGRDGGFDHSVWRQGDGGKHADIWLLWDWANPEVWIIWLISPVNYNAEISMDAVLSLKTVVSLKKQLLNHISRFKAGGDFLYCLFRFLSNSWQHFLSLLWKTVILEAQNFFFTMCLTI